ncbi:hypothetical protein NXX05_11540 [Bacteroides thetaiotaomicron]|nr:hypothetical protein [Bacteroides thetaiotaomicron]
MNRAGLLQETTAWMDTVDLALCLFIYEVCNDYQFEYLSGSDFVNFLNLKPTEREVIVRPKENLRICYMVFSIARTIRPRERGKLWSEEFLKRMRHIQILLRQAPQRCLQQCCHQRESRFPQIHRQGR